MSYHDRCRRTGAQSEAGDAGDYGGEKQDQQREIGPTTCHDVLEELPNSQPDLRAHQPGRAIVTSNSPVERGQPIVLDLQVP
jgi:hypothetical protein